MRQREVSAPYAENWDGRIFHTYSVYGRGGEEFLRAYRYLDLMPKGRDESASTRLKATQSP